MTTEGQITTPNQELSLSDVDEIILQARAGDKSVVPRLKVALKQFPMLWANLGDIAKHSKMAWIRLIAGDDLLMQESLNTYLVALCQELAGPNPSMMEVLLVDRAVSCWLQLEYAEMQLAAQNGSGLHHRALLQKQADSANRRFASSTKMLLTLQHLLPPKTMSADTAIATPVAETAGVRPEADTTTLLQDNAPATNGRPPKRKSGKPAKADNANGAPVADHVTSNEEAFALAALEATKLANTGTVDINGAGEHKSNDRPADLDKPPANCKAAKGRRVPARRSANGEKNESGKRFEPVHRFLDLLGGERGENRPFVTVSE